MLEKIGLPAKPSLRGSNWVVDATHCQGCSSQFTFINRKHHCRRCGGLFCGSCTQQRMVLRGQGDSTVRICEPCKKLEEAARFEMRYGHKNRAGRGSSRLTSIHDDGLLKQILDNHANESSSSGQSSVMDLGSSFPNPNIAESSVNPQELDSLDREGQISRIPYVDEPDYLLSQIGSTSREELRQRALDERRVYKVLKGEGKSEEALKAFKRAKDLERQADALDLSIRKNRRKVLTSGGTVEIQKKDNVKSGRKSQQQNDLTAELRQLGWSDTDMHDEDKRSANMSLEGELSSLIRDVAGRTNKDAGTSCIDQTQVVAHKRKALTLKREGKLAEAKEELKKAKALEKKLEEQELLSVAEDSDDEISALIHSMDNDKQDKLLVGYEQEYGFDFDHLTGIADDLGVNDSFEVTDEDLVDPEITATLKSLGWADDSNKPENIEARSIQIDKEALRSEILSMKKEALNQKHTGHLAEAMAHLRKANLLERDHESLEGQDSLIAHDHTVIQKGSSTQNVKEKNDVDSKVAPKNRLKIQKELLALKRKALSLRKEGKFDEADEELKRGRVLEHQLEELEYASKVKDTQATVYSEDKDLADEHSGILESPAVGEQDEEDVTDQDMSDPTYLSVLRNLGWKDEDNEATDSQFKPPKEKITDHSMKTSSLSVVKSTSNVSTRTRRRSYAEIQRELLNLKRKALSLRRQGKINEAEEVLMSAKTLEAEMAELEATRKEIQVEVNSPKDDISRPLHSATEEGYEVNVSEEDMYDQAHLLMLKNLGWSDEGQEALIREGKLSKKVSASSVHSIDPILITSSSSVSFARPRSKGETQQELLGMKRKALALKRKGEAEQAEELLKMAKVLEAQTEELGKPKMGPLSSESLMKHEEIDDVKDAVVAMGSVEIDDDSLLGLRGKESAIVAPLTSAESLFPATSQQLTEDNYPLIQESSPQRELGFTGTAGMSYDTGIAPSQQLMNLKNLLTGDEWKNSQTKPEDSWQPASHVLLESEGPPKSFRSKDEEIKFKPDNQISKGVKMNKRDGEVNVDKKQPVFVTISAQEVGSTNNKNSPRQEVLILKRKAVALKKDGKLIEAREELRQAKLLEKSLDEDTCELQTGTHDISANVPIAPSAQDQASAAPTVSPKLLSGRDRFKLQQESLSLKREALKLRRENRMDEAEAKFEMAKAIEAQLEEFSSQVSKKSSVNVAEFVDDVIVEDLLDPQLLSALKAIGVADANTLPQPMERPQPVKVTPPKSENISHERIQLEERIKAEKVKAVSLKRSGKQAEALDALRQAKVFEKKLNSLTSN